MSLLKVKHWLGFWMEKASKQLGNPELESKEEVRLEIYMGIIQKTRIMKSWE